MLSFLGRKTIYEADIKEEPEMNAPEEGTVIQFSQIAVEAAKKVSIETVEELMEKMINFEFLTTSANDGTLIGVVRTEDVMRVLCNYFEVDGKKTKYQAYSS